VDLKGKVVLVRRSFHLGVHAAAKTKRSVRRMQLTEELVELLRQLQPLRVEPATPVFTNLDGMPIEPESFATQWYAYLRGPDERSLQPEGHVREFGIDGGRQRPLARRQVGVSYLVLRKHYGRDMTSEGPDQPEKMRTGVVPGSLPADAATGT
jgi:hypothetical protein